MVAILPLSDATDAVAFGEFWSSLERSIYNPFLYRPIIPLPAFGAWVENKLIGVGCLDIGVKPTSKHTAELAVAVSPEYREAGVGSQLMEAMIIEARKRGMKKIWLRVYETNHAARKLYKRFGFKEEGFFKNQEWNENEPLNVISMGLLLT